jgi:hypothetical protein
VTVPFLVPEWDFDQRHFARAVRKVGLRLREPGSPIEVGVRDVGVVVAPEQPRSSSCTTTAARDVGLRKMADAQFALHVIEDFAASLVRRHDPSIPGSAQADPSRSAVVARSRRPVGASS